MLFVSSLSSLCAWRSARFPLSRFVPLAGLLVWSAHLAGGANGVQTLAAFLIALALLAQFRLWDDLVDRERDQDAHPERILARVAHHTSFNHAVYWLAVTNALALLGLHGLSALVGFAGLSTVAALWYRSARTRELMHGLVLHLKYPAFVLIIAPTPVPSAAPVFGAVIVYAAMLGFELLDEPRLRAASGRWFLAGCLGVLTIAPLITASSPMAIAACGVAGALLSANWRDLLAARAHAMVRYLPFALASIALTFATIGGFR